MDLCFNKICILINKMLFLLNIVFLLLWLWSVFIIVIVKCVKWHIFPHLITQKQQISGSID